MDSADLRSGGTCLACLTMCVLELFPDLILRCFLTELLCFLIGLPLLRSFPFEGLSHVFSDLVCERIPGSGMQTIQESHVLLKRQTFWARVRVVESAFMGAIAPASLWNSRIQNIASLGPVWFETLKRVEGNYRGGTGGTNWAQSPMHLSTRNKFHSLIRRPQTAWLILWI